MRDSRLLLYLVAAAFVTLPGCGGPDYETPRDLADAVVGALARGDRAAFDAAFPTEQDIRGLADQGNEEFRKEVAKDIEAFVERGMKRIAKDRERSWGVVNKGIKEDGLDPKSLKIEGVEYKVMERYGLKKSDIYVTLSAGAGDERYILKLDDCTPTDRGWLMFDSPRWRGKKQAKR